MSGSRAKKERAAMRARGEDDGIIRTRIRRGEVENLLQREREAYATVIQSYHEEVLVPSMQRTLILASQYRPLWRRVVDPVRAKWGAWRANRRFQANKAKMRKEFEAQMEMAA